VLAGFVVLAMLCAALPAAKAEHAGLAVSLAADRPAYASGEPVAFSFTVANHAAAPLALDFASAQRFDAAISDGAGREVFRWSAGRMFAQFLGQEILAPERPSLRYEATFTGRLKPGLYRLRAWLTDDSGDYSATLGFLVH
jgi:hypothetical protein